MRCCGCGDWLLGLEAEGSCGGEDAERRCANEEGGKAIFATRRLHL
jgi:hypothetical protein